VGFFQRGRFGFDFIPLKERLPIENRSISEVWDILEVDSEIFYSTTDQLLKLDGEIFEAINLPGALSRSFDIKDELIVHVLDKGLFVYQNDQLVNIPNTKAINDVIISMIPREAGFICFTVSGQIFEISNDKVISYNNELVDELGTSIVNTAIRLKNGDIAIGTQNSGLFIINAEMEIKKHLTKGQVLTNRTIMALHEDDFNNLWIGLHNGLNYVELSSPLSVINEQTGLEGTGYTAALYNGKIYAGTNNGLFIQLDDKDKTSQYRFELISGTEGQANNLSKIHGDLILNHHRGAFLVDGESIDQFYDVGSWQFKETRVKNLILGGSYTGLSLFENSNGSWEKVKDLPGLNESSRILAFENDSTLWMTHGYKGAYLIQLDQNFNPKGIRRFGAEDGFPSNTLISVYQLNDNLVFTGESGVYDFNAESERFTPNPFFTEWLGQEHVSKIVQNKNDIYFIEDRQLGRLRQESFGKFEKETRAFSRINNYLSDDLENISVLDDRNILIGAKEGFIHLDPTREFVVKEEFKVILKPTELTFSNDSIVTISHDYFKEQEFENLSSIKFQFASPYFDGFEDIEYSYKMKPLDNRWSDWSHEGTREYNHLPQGNYEFMVKARNVYGIESKSLSVSFDVIPPWYKSNPAFVGYFFLAVISVFIAMYAQRRKYTNEKEELTTNTQKVLKVKDEEISEISEKSKKEIEEIKNEKLKNEIHHKNHQLTSVTMHLINKNEFVQEVRQNIEESLKSDHPNVGLKKILKNIDKNLSSDDSWEQFAFHFDQVHGDFLKKLSSSVNKLTPQETKLAAYLRMNMTSKEIAHLMNISVRGVELARYRLRKKLSLERDQNLTDFLLQY
ncbi:MAG: triple tyrosine motif-containing protein, partial [Cyclobacteriaceae bacterium]